jgi:drug/metabolite transporter (DMT)-like permease
LRWTASLVAWISVLAVVATAVGWALWLLVLSRLPPAAAGVASLATPVVGIALAAVQLGEIPSRTELAGVAAIVAALVVNARAGASDAGAARGQSRVRSNQQ